MAPTVSTQVQFNHLDKPRLPSDETFLRPAIMGDLDGDGDVDLVRGNHILLNDGSGNFSVISTDRLSNNGRDLALGDVDGDGDLDLVGGNAPLNGGFGVNALYLNDGNGAFTDVTNTHMPNLGDDTEGLALGDVDGDGDLDLVTANSGDKYYRGVNRLYLNDGTGRFRDVSATHLPPDDGNSSRAVALGDVDGDGDIDMVFGNDVDSHDVGWFQNTLLLNNGVGVFTDVTATHMPPDTDMTVELALGDIDGDGDVDLVLGNLNVRTFGIDRTGQTRLYLNNGAGVFTDTTSSHMPADSAWTASLGLSDVDEDGDPDLLLGNWPADAGDVLYLNDGSGIFTDATDRIVLEPESVLVAHGDVDNDGDVDLLFGFGNGPQDRIYLNLHRQLHTPRSPAISQTFEMEFYAKPGYGNSFHTAIPALNLSLAPSPMSLPTLGDLYLELNGIINLPWVAIPPATGLGALEVQVPPDPSLAGQTVYVQALIVNNALPWGDSHLTSYTSDMIMK